MEGIAVVFSRPKGLKINSAIRLTPVRRKNRLEAALPQGARHVLDHSISGAHKGPGLPGRNLEASRGHGDLQTLAGSLATCQLLSQLHQLLSDSLGTYVRYKLNVYVHCKK